jgi:hypothetical protein
VIAGSTPFLRSTGNLVYIDESLRSGLITLKVESHDAVGPFLGNVKYAWLLDVLFHVEFKALYQQPLYDIVRQSLKGNPFSPIFVALGDETDMEAIDTNITLDRCCR